MIKYILTLSLIALLFVLCQPGARAQSPGSESVYGGLTSTKSIGTGGSSADVSESLYIGPGTHVIDGDWEIYAKYVIIDPLAVITGTGVIKFYNPSVAGGAASGTILDGNAPAVANTVDVNMELYNDEGMQLTERGFPADLIIDGWMNNTISSTLYVGKDLNLEVDGADVTLGVGVVGDLRFDADATISNYRPARMVIVNNSILSHMVKESFTGSFVFPVGISDGDYTPAQITNVSSNTVHVGVQDYVASTSVEATTDPGPSGVAADGMKRTWHIYADASGTGATVNLQHNSSTNQSGFADASHFVTRWGTAVPNSTGDNTVGFSSSSWQVNTLAAGATGTLLTPSGTLPGSSMRSRAYSTFATSPLDAESYFTKSSDPFHPLPVNLISFSASSNQCDVVVKWASGVEHDLASYQLQHSTDGSQYSTIAILSPTGSNSSYSYVDKSPAQGNNQYRLKMADNDGKYQSSAIQQVKIDCAGSNAFSINVYPNPTSNLLTVEGMGANASSTLRVMNIHGQLVQELNTTNNKATLDISQLPSANYVLQVVQGNEIKINVKVVKQ